MKIESYIAQLLYRFPCVTVPGFGAFLTEMQSAQWQESSNTFFPPKKIISFNSYIKNNDGLLANHIAQAEKTSYEYAVSVIEYAVFNWQKNLREKESFFIKNVGHLRLNQDQNVVFSPSDDTNYLSSSFGLAPFVSPIIKREIFEEKIEAIAYENPNSLVPEKENIKKHNYFKYAAVFVIGLGIIGSIGYPIYENKIASETILIEAAVQKKVQNKIQEATFLIKSPLTSVTLAVKDGKMPYHIMAGAFRNERNAQKVLENLIQKGFSAKRINSNKYGLYPVIYGSYATYTEAEKAKKDIQNTINPEAWILIESL